MPTHDDVRHTPARFARAFVPAADRPLADALDAALPVYRRHWWPEHDRRNRAWIEAVAPTLEAVEGDVVPRLEAAYGGTWPGELLPVDIVPYANAVGAYSTDGRVVVSSSDPAIVVPRAVELVFHETSHTDGMENPLREGLERAFRAAAGEAPDRLWHDMIFYTAGEIVGIVLAEHGEPGYRHYGAATGVYRRGERWTWEIPAFEAHWRPFLRSGSDDPTARRAALEAFAREVLAAGGG